MTFPLVFVSLGWVKGCNGYKNRTSPEPHAWNSGALLVDFMRKHHLGHCNRAISDKQESASILRPGASEKGGWKDAGLASSGLLARGLIRG